MVVALAALLAALLTGCRTAADAMPSSAAQNEPGVRLPPEGGFDYQLGGAYDPPAGTTVIVRDSTASPPPGMYAVCYLNGFQSQPGSAGKWQGLLLEYEGAPVADPGWPDEFLLDTSDASQRARIAERLALEIRGCKQDGYAAVEFDNLDSYLRSHGALDAGDNLALADEYVAMAHREGLAVAQKNAAELSARAQSLGFDFAVTEECGAYDECAEYASVYDIVLDVEYGTPAAFDALCARGALPPHAVLRDRDLSPAGAPGHAHRRCA